MADAATNPALPPQTLLRRALELVGAGRLEAGRALCREALGRGPDDAPTLYLLGLIAHRLGDHQEAAATLRAAAESPAAAAVHLLSYAELCLKPRNLRAALDACRRAVTLEPTLPIAWVSLGRLSFECGNYEESRDCFDRALSLDPGSAPAHSGLANTLGRLGQSTAAVDLFEALLTAAPGNGEAHAGFALLLQDLGRCAEALHHAELAVASRPDRLDFQLRAAGIESQMNRYPAALQRLGRHARTGRRDVNFLTLEAHLLRSLDRFEEAVELCRAALDDGLDSPALRRAYGLALQLSGRDGEALEMFVEAAQMSGVTRATAAAAWVDQGVLLTHLGQMDAASRAFEQALEADPTHAEAWYHLRDPDIAALERLLGHTHVSHDRMLLHFALGKSHFAAGATETAFRHWNAANRCKRTSIDYDADAAESRLRAAATGAAADRPADPPAALSTSRRSLLPVFVVGMPRSGSSLVEQILASHPAVHGAGELLQLRALFAAATPGDEDSLAESALAKLTRHAESARGADPRRGAALRIIDKDLANFEHLGIIHRTFPNARILHCRRDPLDTCFSAYVRLFAGDLGFCYDQVELGRYYREYHALMAHWRRVLPRGVFMDIDYEALVADTRTETARLLDFLELDWHDDCMRFFATPRPVRTASVTAVRQPIYPSSIGRAHALRSHLAPLLGALGPLGCP